MHGVIAASAGSSAWSFGGSILTFAFPMILFVVVAVALYVAYTKPELSPGHRNPAVRHPVSYTAVPGRPAAEAGKAESGKAEAGKAEAGPGDQAEGDA